MDSRGNACVSAQLLRLFKRHSQLHEVKPHILSISDSTTAVHVWMKGGTRVDGAAGDGEDAG